MADQRANRAERDLPADEPRDKSDSKLRLVTPDAAFFEVDVEPNDESPTIISKLPARTDSSPGKETADLHGRKLAHFELLESIGVGGMAAVLRARDSQLDRIVALKILPPEMARDPENIRRFHQEARAAAKLDHENIARVFYCGEDQELHFIAFEYVEGDNLRVILERRGHLPYAEAIRYVLQIATGLEHAASRGVVHRDVKPSNIIITPNGRVAKLVDMGLARSLEPHADNGLTQSGVTLGTFDYISPEQALEPREADCRSDIYSLGCTFYHMLTGQPPVPEGTAAKKLQHHQHVAPVDPRQLNPDIPDDVARILSKMMAKNVRDRYQRPIQLVQHLLQVAKANGDDLGREAIYVDVNVPAEPQRRPLLLVSLATLALAGLLFLLSLAPQATKKGGGPPKNGNPAQGSLVVQTVPDTPKSVAPTPTVIRTEDDLQKKLASAADGDKLTIALANDIFLTGKLKIAGSALSRPTIEIVGSDRQPVRLVLNLDKAPSAPLTGLQIDGASVTFKNVRFEIVADPSVKRLDVPVAAVAVSGSSVVDFDQCWFAQTGLPLDVPFILRRQLGLVPAASVLVDASKPGGEIPKVTLRESYFPTGQTAIATIGSGKVSARDCAFHTLGTLVHLRGGGDATVSLDHCSAYLRFGPAFRIDDETACRLNIDYSVFSVPANAISTGDEPGLLRQTDSLDKSKILYLGQSNGYQNLNNLWVYGGSKFVTVDDLARFRQEISLNKGSDKDSQILAKDPPAFVNEGTTKFDDQIVGAFQLNHSVREVQVPREKYNKHTMLGIRHCIGLTMPRLPPLPMEAMPVANDYKPAANEKVVDPDHVGSAAGYFDSLDVALVVCRAGDIVTLKPGAAGAEFSLRPTEIEHDLTIRGFPGTQPTLTLADNRISDSYLFRVLDTRLHLENLNLVLEPGRDKHVSQALVAMVGNGSCSIKNCTITLRPRDRANPKAIPLSVVALFAAEDQKMMTNDARPALAAAVVTMHDCFVRGDGDCVTLRGSRPVNIQIGKSLFYLGGSLVHQLASTTKEIANPDAAIAVKMKDSAFFFADPLLWLQAGRTTPRHQHPLRVEQADHCLFATLGDRPLAAFETPEVTEQTLPQLFEWKGQGNAYVHFDKHLLEHAPADDPLRSFQHDDAGWKETFERDGDSHFLPMGFKTLPARPLAAATPDDAVARTESLDILSPYLTQLPRFHLPKN